MRLSIVVPAHNEAAGIAATLALLAPLRETGTEVVLADGGSTDATAANARPLCDRLIVAPRGRALQMNAGAAAASGDVFLFLHADTCLPDNAVAAIARATRSGGYAWGRFDVTFDSPRPMLKVVAWMMNLRSRATGIATGDQGMFMTGAAFAAAGGFPPIALMEDIAMSRTLKRLARPICLREKVLTSARRWETRGVWRTIALMWALRLAYALGADPAALARRYR